MTTTSTRDIGLDVIKGLGCVLMVIAHSKLKMWDYEEYLIWGNLAPALFFSASGVTATFQTKKPLKEMLVLYGFIFLLGLSYSGFLHDDFLSNFQFEIIQVIALSVLTIYCIEKYFQPKTWGYLFLGITAFVLDKIIYPLGFEKIEGILIAPGVFPFLPWLSLFFLGVFAYRIKNLYNLIIFFTLSIIYYSLFGWGIPEGGVSKRQFLLDFFILSSMSLFFVFFLVRSVKFLQNKKLNWVVLFLGENSLLFLYIHYAFIKFFRLFEIQRDVEIIWEHPWLFWVLILFTSTFAMLLIKFISPWVEVLFQNIFTWLFLLLLVFIAPYIITKTSYIGYFELLLGILFATYYSNLGKIIKRESHANYPLN
ncbi:MAG: hypothetical protein UZ14_CFX002001559 [Chloroflexi bacterium OLB14]|nr:MAG: hypothetical protein UZ14_CFX002001559 [Chloroflexi bacterium OLB14]